MPRREHRHWFKDNWAIWRLAGAQWRTITGFVLLYVLCSIVATGALIALNEGFATSGAAAGGAPSLQAYYRPVLDSLGVQERFWWLVFFGLFLLLGLVNAGLDHLGWIIRLNLLSVFEARQMERGLRLICSVDPRDGVGFTRREMLLALRSDCKSLRVVFQMQLLSIVTLVQVVVPLIYLLQLEAAMATAALAMLSIGAIPVAWLVRRAGEVSLERQDATHYAGGRVSELLGEIQNGVLRPGDHEAAIRDVGEALAAQHKLWRTQFLIRSMSEKAPLAISLMVTFVLLLWGVYLIRQGEMSWGTLLTFIVAARIVFTPLVALGTRLAKTAEHFYKARRHLVFTRTLARSRNSDRLKMAVTEPVRSLVIRNFPLTDSSPERLSTTLRQGDILTIVDPEISVSNPLLRALTGRQYAPAGTVLADGLDVNDLDYPSIQAVFAGANGPLLGEGALADIMRLSNPGVSDEELAEFVENVLTYQMREEMPDGLRSVVDRQAKRSGKLPLQAFYIPRLYHFFQQAPGVVLAEQFQIVYPYRRIMIERFVQRYRERFITIWADSAPREELGHQEIVVFSRGQYVGTGDLAWFKSEFPDWDYGRTMARDPAAAAREGQNEALDEEVIDES